MRFEETIKILVIYKESSKMEKANSCANKTVLYEKNLEPYHWGTRFSTLYRDLEIRAIEQWVKVHEADRLSLENEEEEF